jgi:hypothetical protein
MPTQASASTEKKKGDDRLLLLTSLLGSFGKDSTIVVCPVKPVCNAYMSLPSESQTDRDSVPSAFSPLSHSVRHQDRHLINGQFSSWRDKERSFCIRGHHTERYISCLCNYICIRTDRCKYTSKYFFYRITQYSTFYSFFASVIFIRITQYETFYSNYTVVGWLSVGRAMFQ